MRDAGLEEAQAGLKIAGRNINNLRHADDTTLLAESEEELKTLMKKVKERGEWRWALHVGRACTVQRCGWIWQLVFTFKSEARSFPAHCACWASESAQGRVGACHLCVG